MAEPGGETTGSTEAGAKQTFTFHLPDGKSASIGAPKGTSPEQAWGYLVQQHPEYGQKQQGGRENRFDPPAESDTAFRAGAEDFLQGINTGIAGDIVGAGQLARHVLPDWLTNPIANSQIGQKLSEQAQRPSEGWSGTAGNFFGAALPFMAVPGLGPTWGPAARVVTRSTLPAAVQPVDPKDPDYWSTKALQTGVGTVAGEALHGLGSMGARALANIKNSQAVKSLSELVEQINQKIRGENVAKQSEFETRLNKTQRTNEKIGERNKAIDERYQGEQERQRQATALQRQAVAAAKAAQDAVPGQTTQGWWREALTPIGEQARAPAAASPTASAQVRQIIGNRLNNIRGQMRIGRDDMGFRTEIDGIRDQVHSRLATENMQNSWHFEPQERFDAQGNPLPPSQAEVTRERNSLWSQYVEQPLENLPELSGRQMADYVSRLGDMAEDFARQARRAPQAERPELETISEGLRDVVDVVDRRGAQGNPALRANLQNAKRSYYLWSMGNDSVDISGHATPAKIARVWTRRQGGSANYGAEMDPGNPRYHPENARLKQWLERARAAHETPPPPVVPPTPVPRPTTKWSPIPTPKKPVPIKEGEAPKAPAAPPPSPAAEAGKAVGRKIIAHGLGGLPGVIAEPFVTSAGRKLARSPTAAKVLSGARHLGMPAAIAGSQYVTPGTDEIPEIVVRPKPGDRN